MARIRQIIYFDGTSVAAPMPAKTRRLQIGGYVYLEGVKYQLWYEEEVPGSHRNFRAERCAMTDEELIAKECA